MFNYLVRYPRCATQPKASASFWQQKLAGNKKRDRVAKKAKSSTERDAARRFGSSTVLDVVYFGFKNQNSWIAKALGYGKIGQS